MKSLSKRLTSAAAMCAAGLCLLLSGVARAELPQIENAHIVLPPPGANVAAAFLTINNSSDESLVITGAASDTIEKLEIHLSSVVDDVAKMEKQDSLVVPAGESLQLKHGSYHIMLMGLGEPLEAGAEVDVQLETSAGLLTIVIPVVTRDEAMKMGAMGHDKKMDHGNMDDGKTMDHDQMKDDMKDDMKDKMKDMMHDDKSAN